MVGLVGLGGEVDGNRRCQVCRSWPRGTLSILKNFDGRLQVQHLVSVEGEAALVRRMIVRDDLLTDFEGMEDNSVGLGDEGLSFEHLSPANLVFC